jgi:hypothetical protein
MVKYYRNEHKRLGYAIACNCACCFLLTEDISQFNLPEEVQFHIDAYCLYIEITGSKVYTLGSIHSLMKLLPTSHVFRSLVFKCLQVG